MRKTYVRFPLDLRPEVLAAFREACEKNGTKPTTEIKKFIAEYIARPGNNPGFLLPMSSHSPLCSSASGTTRTGYPLPSCISHVSFSTKRDRLSTGLSSAVLPVVLPVGLSPCPKGFLIFFNQLIYILHGSPLVSEHNEAPAGISSRRSLKRREKECMRVGSFP